VIELLVGSALPLVGFAVGTMLARGRKPEPVKAICGCSHSVGFHENKTGRCTHQVERWVSGVGATTVKCRCQHYDGPIPIESFTTTPLLPPRET
jgi:hypothetical protein